MESHNRLADRSATEIQGLVVLISGVFHSAYGEILPFYEMASNRKVQSLLSPSMGRSHDSVISRLERNEPADLLIMAEPGLEAVIAQGFVRSDAKVHLARAPVGVAVKAGSPKPDISSVSKLRDVLLAAESVAYSISASGRYVSEELFARLKIEAQMEHKAHLVDGTTFVAQAVADGTYELGFQSLSELGSVDGVELLGALPAPVGLSTSVAGAPTLHSRNPAGSEELLHFLRRKSWEATLHRHGLEPPEH